MSEPVPAVDLAVIVAAQQDQIDNLTATVERLQQTLDELVRAQPAARPGEHGPAGSRNSTGRR